MQRLFVSLALVALALAPLSAVRGIAHAQDDWGVKRDPFDRKIIARYKGILERNPNDANALRKLVQLYRKHRSIALLTREYQARVDRRPDDFSALVVLGHLSVQTGDTDQAQVYYQRAADVKPGSAAVEHALGDLYRTAGKLAEARQAYERALAALPRSKQAKDRKTLLRALADMALDAGEVDRARAYYEQYFALDPGDVQARLELGDALVQHGKHDQAIEVFAQAERRMRADPAGQLEVIARLGAAHDAAGRENEAIREYRRAIARVGRDYYMRKELTTRIVDIYRRRQALGELAREFEREWPKSRRKHFEWDMLARLYEETGDQEQAIAASREATRKAPYELDTQRRLIVLLENSGREDEALAQYEAVIRVAPGEPRFQLELAERYWRRGQEKEALALLAKMEKRFPGDAGVHAALADLYSRWGKSEQALEAYARLTRIEPNDVAHLINLGEQHFQRNNKKQADAVWKRIIARKTPESYARLGEVYAEHDMLDQALEMYQKAIKLEPKVAAHYKGRARVYERRRTFPNAVGDWEKVLELTSDKAVDRPARQEARRRVVGLLRRMRGRALQRRVATWRALFQKTPPDMNAGRFLVEHYMSDHDYGNARTVLERLLAIDAEDTEAMEQLVKVYRRRGEYDGAVALLQKLAGKLPARQREFYNDIAEIKTDQRRDDEAIEWINRAVQSSPTDPVAHQRLAERYADMQKFDEAVAAYETTVALDKRNFRAYFALAQLYKYVNQPTKAAMLYREVLARATDEELLAKAGREAIALEEMIGTLGELERTLVPLAFTFSHKPVYRRVLVELYNRYVPHLVGRWRAGDESAHAELLRLGSHGLKPLLEALADDSDPVQQRIAVEVLGYLGNKGAAAPLIRVAEKATEVPIRARHSLGTLMPAIDINDRVSALIAAGRLGDARMIDALEELARHREKGMREAALFALGQTSDAAAIPALVEALRTSRDARGTVACLGLARIPAVTRSRAAVDAMVGVLTDARSPDHARGACAFALGYLGDKKSTPVLLEVLRHGNGEAQRLSAWALGRLGARSAVPALLQAYFSRDRDVREAVGWALGRASRGAPESGEIPGIGLAGYAPGELQYDPRAAVAALPGPLADATPPVSLIVGHREQVVAGLKAALGRHRDMVVRVLEDLDGAAATTPARTPTGTIDLGPLTRGLDELPASQRAQVVKVLEQIAADLAPTLVELAGHRDPKVRALALAVLAKIGSPAAEKALILGMDDAVLSVRRAAMLAATTRARLYPGSGAVLSRALRDRLSADAWQVRAQAAEALGALGPHADRAALEQALSDRNAYVRANAAVALGVLLHADSVGALIAATSDRDQTVASAAARSLAAIGGPRARERLESMARDESLGALATLARTLLQSGKN